MTMLVRNDYPVHEFISKRWSPYSFDDRPVETEDLLSIFEAARWASSSYNAQPWYYIVATKDNPKEFERLLSCLVEGNQIWAKSAPVLALGIAKLNFDYNNKPNRAAIHDLGLAAGNLLFEATARALYVHQMIGILPEKARELYEIPEGYEVMTGIAIGYVGVSNNLPDDIRERDTSRRLRKPLSEFLFSRKWGTVHPILR
jgi:nitroreductase